jgi:hypothetical protein
VIKRLAVAALLTFAIAHPLQAGFAEVARAIDAKDGVSRMWIPFLGLARVAIWVVEPSGVQDFQLVTFKGTSKLDGREMQSLMRSKIGPGFSPLVQVWSRKSKEWSFVYARPHADGKKIELVVLAHDDEETVLVRVSVDSEAVAREINFSPKRVVHVARR